MIGIANQFFTPAIKSKKRSAYQCTPFRGRECNQFDWSQLKAITRLNFFHSSPLCFLMSGICLQRQIGWTIQINNNSMHNWDKVY